MHKINTNISDQVARKTSLKCLSLGESAYSMAKILAQAAELSVSAYLRSLIQRTYKRSKNKLDKEAAAG